MKKLFALLLAIALMLSLSVTAFAEETETATITVHMTDYGYDGWESENSYNYVVALSEPYTGDEFEPDEAIVLAECTFADGDEETATFTIDKMQKVYFYWVEGSYAEECGFTIYRDGTEVYSHVPEAEEGVWACALEDGKLFFTSEFVDNRGTTVTYEVAPTYTVTIPPTVTIGTSGTSAEISAADVVVEKGRYVSVTLAADNNFTVKTAEGAELTYTVTANGENVAAGGEILAVNPADGKTGSANITFDIDESAIQYAGTYTGSATFTIAVKDVPKTIINFSLNGESYQAEEGMTLCQWAESEYDVNDKYYDAGDGTVRVDETLRYKEDVVIVDGGEYWMRG